MKTTDEMATGSPELVGTAAGQPGEGHRETNGDEKQVAKRSRGTRESGRKRADEASDESVASW